MTETYLARFVGGPLDGREQWWPEPTGEPRQTVTHVHLHEGPKIEHHYDLEYHPAEGWRYQLRNRD